MSAITHEGNQPKKMAPREGRHDIENAVPAYHLARAPEREIERLLSMLVFLDPNMPREDWIRAGMAAKAAGLDADDWHEWSRGGATYDEQAATDAWDSFDATGAVTGATLARMARDAGWTESATGALPRSSRPTTSAKPGRTSEEIQAIWDRFAPASADHSYLARKGIKADGLRVVPAGDPLTIKGASMSGWLAVPARTLDGELTSIQFVPPDGGGKLNLPGASISGSVFLFGEIAPGARLFLAEGIATAWAAHKATGDASACVFGWGSAGKVASACRGFHPGTRVVLCPDVDKTEAGRKLAAELGADVVEMPTDIGPHGDAWDLIERRGADALLALIPAHEPRSGPLTGDHALGAAVVWPRPIPLPCELLPVDKLPMDAIPEAFRGWVVDVSERMNCPPDFVAIPMLIAAASLVARRVAVRPQRRTDWTERGSLWALVVGRPGAMKSPAMAQALAPMDRLEARAAEAFREVSAHHETEAIVAKLRAEKRLKDARAELKKDGRAADLAEILASGEDVQQPSRPRYIVNDLTYEKLGEILATNPDGVLSVRDEMRGLLMSLGQEENAPARSFYLQAWSGGRYTFDRIGRGTVTVEDARLSMIGCIQPGPLSDLIQQGRRGRIDDGMIERFLIVWPDSTGEWRDVDRWPDSDAKSRAWETFTRLDGLTAESVGAEADTDANGDQSGLPFLRCDEGAREAFAEWHGDLNRSMADADSQGLEAALSKFRHHVPALALALHVIDGGTGPISEAAMVRALVLGGYFESHTRRLHGSGRRTTIQAAKAILAKARAGDLSEAFTARDVYRNQWSGLTDREAVGDALEMLVGHGWLSEAEAGIGGRPTMAFSLTEGARHE